MAEMALSLQGNSKVPKRQLIVFSVQESAGNRAAVSRLAVSQ